MKRLRHGIGVALAVMMTSAMALSTAEAQTSGLKIVVIEGEDAINVIQQKTAIAPVVEVRDRNDQPVAGAVVRFAIQGGRASFSGARTVSVTTNVAGRAAVSGLTPTGSGTFQITASATFQEQTATVSIAQTNVMTAAQAAQIVTAVGAGTAGAAAGVAGTGAGVAGTGAGVAGAGASGGVAAGAAGGAAAGATGGGLSAVTLGIVGGAVAGGAIATKQLVLGGGGVAGIYEGDFRIDVVESLRQVRGNGTIALSCTNAISFTGEVRGEIDDQADGTLTGTVSANGFYKQLLSTCPPSAPGTNEKIGFGSGVVTGTTAGFQASGQQQAADGTGFGAMAFSGTLNDGLITGTFTIGPSGYKSIPDAGGSFGDSAFPATSTQVRLTK